MILWRYDEGVEIPLAVLFERFLTTKKAKEKFHFLFE